MKGEWKSILVLSEEPNRVPVKSLDLRFCPWDLHCSLMQRPWRREVSHQTIIGGLLAYIVSSKGVCAPEGTTSNITHDDKKVKKVPEGLGAEGKDTKSSPGV